MATYGYARVSTTDQHADRQLTALLASGVERKSIFIDRKSGRNFDRPAWKRLRRRLRKGDLIVVQSIDRLGRSYGEVQDEWRWITKTLGAEVQVLDMPLLDTRKNKNLLGTFIADLVLQVLAYCAQFEREAILTRQRQGIAEAKKRGVRFGRPRRKMPPEFAEAVEMVRCGEISGREAAQLCGMSYSTFRERMHRCKADEDDEHNGNIGS